MKKILILIFVIITMTGCSARMITRQDPITGNTLYYGYSGTFGSKELTNNFNKSTTLNTTIILDSITKEKKMIFSVSKWKNVGSMTSILEASLYSNIDILAKNLTEKDAYVLDIKTIEITNGKDSFKVENLGETKKIYSGGESPHGISTVTLKISDKDLDQLEKIYNSEKIFLVALDNYGGKHLGLIYDKTVMLELFKVAKI